MDEGAVLDASALIALFRGEPGGEFVADVVVGSIISAINLVEVVQAGGTADPSPGRERAEAEEAGVTVASFTASQAEHAGLMQSETVSLGLSLADRACLALAHELGATAFTADRAWAKVDVGVRIELIR